jgi:hypothetical protein
MDDAAEAQALMDDLVALLDAGLIAAVNGDGDTVRYAVVDLPADAQRGGRPVSRRTTA